MSNLTEVYPLIQQEVEKAGARLVAVSKTKPVEAIMTMYALGHRDFGENRVKELLEKHEQLPKDIRWHFIGHLQRNKVKAIAPFIHLIHSGDSPRLLREINKQGKRNDRQIPVLLQYHIADEESKYGLDPSDPAAVFAGIDLKELTGVTIKGVMGMATYTDKDEQIAEEFDQLTAAFRQLKEKHFRDNEAFSEVSMGMSGDYPIALERGSTMVRVGSLLFGSR